LADLSRKRERERLAVRREPYWQRLAEGAYLGFRRGPDTWIARYRGRDGKQQYNSVGEYAEFDDARREAEEWLTQIAGTSMRSVKRASVKAALNAYLADLRRHGRASAAKAAEGMFETVINEDALADKALEAATRDDFEEWRERLTKGRQPRSVNRYVRQIMAGLNRAVELGHIGNPAAWKLKPLQDDVEDDGETATAAQAPQGVNPRSCACVRLFWASRARGSLAPKRPTSSPQHRSSLRTAHNPGVAETGRTNFARRRRKSTRKSAARIAFPPASGLTRSGTRASANCFKSTASICSPLQPRPARH
jgi:hypothetical protein